MTRGSARGMTGVIVGSGALLGGERAGTTSMIRSVVFMSDQEAIHFDFAAAVLEYLLISHASDYLR